MNTVSIEDIEKLKKRLDSLVSKLAELLPLVALQASDEMTVSQAMELAETHITDDLRSLGVENGTAPSQEYLSAMLNNASQEEKLRLVRTLVLKDTIMEFQSDTLHKSLEVRAHSEVWTTHIISCLNKFFGIVPEEQKGDDLKQNEEN